MSLQYPSRILEPRGSRLLALTLIAAVGSAGSAHGQVAGSPPPGTRQGGSPGAQPADRVGVLPPGVGIPVGQPAPDASIHDDAGRALRLSELWKAGPVILVFYRGGWCPYCAAQIRELTKAMPEYAKRGIRPVVISVDRVEESAKSQARYSIPFPVLSDPDLEAHRAYRVLNRNDESATSALRSLGIDLEKASGRAHHTIAIPAVFVIDASGVVRLAHADKDYTTRPSTSQLLGAIDGLSLPRP